MEQITIHAARAIIRNYLVLDDIPFTKITSHTADFTDLARARCIFVTVHGWQPNPVARDLQELAVSHGFRVQFKGQSFLTG